MPSCSCLLAYSLRCLPWLDCCSSNRTILSSLFVSCMPTLYLFRPLLLPHVVSGGTSRNTTVAVQTSILLVASARLIFALSLDLHPMHTPFLSSKSETSVASAFVSSIKKKNYSQRSILCFLSWPRIILTPCLFRRLTLITVFLFVHIIILIWM